MSKFTDEMFETASSSKRGLVTGEPEAALRQSWGEIHEQARRMAGALADAGVEHGDAIGILAGQPVDIAPACQATWMRGASVTIAGTGFRMKVRAFDVEGTFTPVPGSLARSFVRGGGTFDAGAATDVRAGGHGGVRVLLQAGSPA